MDRDLIQEYVTALRDRLGWRADVDDVADEVADHLHEHADRLVRGGLDPREAQRRTLACFGDLGLVARTFAEASSGDLAVPTRTTRLAGVAGIAAGGAWLGAAVAAIGGGATDLVRPWSPATYQIWSVVLAVATALTTLTVAGALVRIGRLRTAVGRVTVGVGVLLSLAMTVVGYAVTYLSVPLGLAVLVALRGRPAEARAMVRSLRGLAVWVVGGAAVVLFDEIVPIGPVDSYGDHPVAWLVPFLACALVSASVLAVAGVRMRAERAVDLGDDGSTPFSPAAA